MLGDMFKRKCVSVDHKALGEEAVQAYKGRCSATDERVALLSMWKGADAELHHKYLILKNSPANSKHRKMYSYLKCLTPADKLAFQREVIERLIVKYSNPSDRRQFILSGTIEDEEWKSVMSSVNLTVNYQLWRYATKYEKYGPRYPKNQHQQLTKLHVESDLFVAKDADRHTRTVDVLWAPLNSNPWNGKHLTSKFFVCEAFRESQFL